MEINLKFIDLHVHSCYSKHAIWGEDALNTPKQIIQAAIKKGLNGVAITDHNSTQGGIVGLKCLKEIKGHDEHNGFLVVPGSEILSADGDIIALGIIEDIEPNLPAIETIERIKEAGGVAIAAHPYLSLTRSSVNEKYIKSIPKGKNFDAIEVFNASIGYRKNAKAKKLAESLNLPGTGSSDAHWVYDIGNGVTSFELDQMSLDAVLKSIKAGKVIPFGKKNSILSRIGLYIGKFFHMVARPWRSKKDKDLTD